MIDSNNENKLICELEDGEQSKMISYFDPEIHLEQLHEKYIKKAGL